MRIFKAFLTTALFLPVASGARAETWRVSDVSILLPLPRAPEMNHLISVESDPRLFPLPVQTRLSKLVVAKDVRASLVDLRVIGFRLDPCFVEGRGPLACRKQIRFVWQPLRIIGETTSARDAAVHTFYDLDDAEWNRFLTGYRDVLRRTRKVDLAEEIRSEGYESRLWNDLKSLLTRTCGRVGLSRVTEMTLDFNENQWVFRGFDVGESVRPIRIPLVNKVAQVVSMSTLEDRDLHVAVNPNAFSETALWIFDNSEQALKQISVSALRSFTEDLERFEDPSKENSGTIDCASCHLAQPAGDWDARLHLGAFENFEGPTAPTSRLRAFGYSGVTPTRSRRALNESEKVARDLNSLGLDR